MVWGVVSWAANVGGSGWKEGDFFIVLVLIMVLFWWRRVVTLQQQYVVVFASISCNKWEVFGVLEWAIGKFFSSCFHPHEPPLGGGGGCLIEADLAVSSPSLRFGNLHL